MNKSIIIIFILQLILAFTAAVVGSAFNMDKNNILNFLERKSPEDETELKSYIYYLIKYMGTWILIFTNFVPISLMVQFELVKFWQAMFMAVDHQMYDKE